MNQLFDPPFRCSSFCDHARCVKVAPLPGGLIAVRDSKDPNPQHNVYTAAEWVAFVQGVKAGEFDFDLPTKVAVVGPDRDFRPLLPFGAAAFGAAVRVWLEHIFR